MRLGSSRTLFRSLAISLTMLPLSLSVVHAQDATSLRARHELLRRQLLVNHFDRPLYIESSEIKGALIGDVFAEIGKPYAHVAKSLQGAEHWCDILILHLNVKGCLAEASSEGETLNLHIGKKSEQRLADTYTFGFLFRAVTVHDDYLQIRLHSPGGPFGTSDYRVTLELVRLDERRSFLHLSYAYRSGVVASMAMKTYLATAGRSKVGFSISGHKANGQPQYVGGVRGVIERNTMRYYLAIESFLDAPDASPQQVEKRLNDWHSYVEQYPLQLHEIQRADYLKMKHKELARQQSLITALTAPG